jgi:hypothetical protein
MVLTPSHGVSGDILMMMEMVVSLGKSTDPYLAGPGSYLLVASFTTCRSPRHGIMPPIGDRPLRDGAFETTARAGGREPTSIATV